MKSRGNLDKEKGHFQKSLSDNTRKNTNPDHVHELPLSRPSGHYQHKDNKKGCYATKTSMKLKKYQVGYSGKENNRKLVVLF